MTDKTMLSGIVKKELKIWLLGSLVMACSVGVLLLMSPSVLSVTDPYASIRGALDRVIAGLMGIIVMSGGLIFLDTVTPGDFFQKIEEEPYACMGIGIAWVWGLVQFTVYL